LVWTSGPNAGIEVEIKSYVAKTFIFWDPMLDPIAVGNAYTVVPGCDRLPPTCKIKFNNFRRYGGYDQVIGRDEIAKTPIVK
jgi:hypothetical protein